MTGGKRWLQLAGILVLGVALLLGGAGCDGDYEVPTIQSGVSTPVELGTVAVETAEPELTVVPASTASAVSTPSPEAIAEIQALIDEGKYQAAIDKTIEVYGLDVSNAPSVEYDSTVPAGYYATTDPADGSIHIDSLDRFSSPNELASCIGHEVIHANQIAEGRSYYGVDENGDPYIIDDQGAYLMDYEAWKWEQDHAAQNNLSADEKAEVDGNVEYYYNQLTPENQALADTGVYVLPDVTPYSPE